MAQAFVQGRGAQPGGSSVALAFTAGNTLGNYLVICGYTQQTGGSATISDSAGNTYVPIDNLTVTGTTAMGFIWIVSSCAAGANTVTINFTGTSPSFSGIMLQEYSGVTGTGADSKNTAISSGGGAMSTANLTVGANQGIFAYVYCNAGITTPTGTGYTQREAIGTGAYSLDQLNATPGSQPVAFTSTGLANYAIIAFLLGSSAGSGSAGWMNRQRAFINKR